ncbi:MAG: hypothetical protein ABI462_12785 [Ignavibacteria bacterium]
MKLRLFYEMNNYESFIYEIDAYHHFLDNNKIHINTPGLNKNRNSSTKKYIDYLKKLFILKNEFTKEKYLELKVLAESEYSNNAWLKEKIKEIEVSNGIKQSKRIIS